MEYSAIELATRCRDGIRRLKLLSAFEKNDKTLYNELRDLSGLSFSHIAAFVRDPNYNITVTKLDRLVAAVKILTEREVQ